MKQLSCSFWIAGRVSLCCLATASPSWAQVSSDGTLPTNVTTTDNLNFTITDGERAGTNLFHSFSEFSVPTKGSAFFNNAADIQNIISRVTGSSVSNIDGLITANPSANLFLLNPNGIIFGPNARLNIGGSFIASTASSLNFADGTQFNATATQTTPLLTVSVPIGLQFGSKAREIRVQGPGAVRDSDGILVNREAGLQVLPEETLALVGNNVALEGGILTTDGGRIELGSVAEFGQVSLNPTDKGWALGYQSVHNFRDIKLSQQSAVDASGVGGGDVQVQGRQITLTNGSQIESSTLIVRASDSVELSGQDQSSGSPSGLSTQAAESAGSGGILTIETRRLIVNNGAVVSASTFGAGNAGALIVRASDSVELSGEDQSSRFPSGLFTQQGEPEATGNGGILMIETRQLIVQNGAQVSASTFGAGNAGALIVRASDSVELSGEGKKFSSGLFTQAELEATGNGEALLIETRQLIVQNGAVVSASTFGAGNAGALIVRASDSVELSGEGQSSGSSSGLFAQADRESTGDGGNLTIETGRLSVRDGARVAVRSLGTGKAGNLIINADLINLNRGTLTAQTVSGEGGDINIKSGSIELLNESEISTTAGSEGGSGNGGNITINADTLVGIENSDITANAFDGRGGVITINAQGIFGLEVRNPINDINELRNNNTSDISAASQQDPSLNGEVEINTPEVDPSQGLVALPAEVVDASGLIAQGCNAGDEEAGSQFIVTGRGGLPPNPSEPLSSDTVWEDDRLPATTANQHSSDTATIAQPSKETATNPMMPATGWVFINKGEVTLTAQAPTVTPQSPSRISALCNGT